MELTTRTTQLRTARPFAFEHSLSFYCSFPPTRGEQRLEEGALTKAIALDDRAALVTVHDDLRCDVTTRGAIDEATFERAIDRVRFQLSLDDDVSAFYALAHDDEKLAPVIRRWFGHHHVKFPSPFEIAVWAVLAQRNMRTGKKTKQAIVETFGPRIDVAGEEHRAFPEPAAMTDVRRLRDVVRDAAKAEAIAVLARTFAEIDVKKAILEQSYDEALAFLRTLPRIGPWSAAFIAFRGLGRMERLAERSDPIFAAARRVYGDVSDGAVRSIAERYGAWCGYWSLYLRRG